MGVITAGEVKALRERSGVGMMDCKRALEETDGDMEAAVDWLRAKGLAKAAKKAGRTAAEGAVALATRSAGAGMVGALVELNAETDFVARNPAFQNLARKIAGAALDIEGDIETLRLAPIAGAASVGAAISELIGSVGENMVLRRFARFSVASGAVAGYVHGALAGAPDLGRIGVLVALEGAAGHESLVALGRNIALHIAASSPLSLRIEDLDPASVNRERAIFAEQSAASGKPPAVIEKMVEGRLRKFYEEAVLLEQAYVKNPDQRVREFLAEEAKAAGAPIEVAGFVRFALGEGIEKEKGDFASEVAALSKIGSKS
ncbi:MAG: translation elongation factor Ts [Caulobacteraceae bacterium]